MSRNGKNFFWPVIPDIQILKNSGVLTKLKMPPTPVSSRFFQLMDYREIDDLYKNIL